MQNWMILALLIALILVIIFYPEITNGLRMSILTIMLAAIIGYLAYSSYVSLTKVETTDNECNTCNGPQSQQQSQSTCDECDMSLCQCAQVLPGQTRCPKCDASSLTPTLPGITSCASCHRNYRCPGCLLT
jgi:hypothetical protein